MRGYLSEGRRGVLDHALAVLAPQEAIIEPPPITPGRCQKMCKGLPS